MAGPTPARAAEAAERREFDDLPAEGQRLIWCAWLRSHGIDPNCVIVPGWIERQPELRRIAWETLAEDDRGQFIVRDDWAVRAVRYLQLESPPLPFPDDYGTPAPPSLGDDRP